MQQMLTELDKDTIKYDVHMYTYALKLKIPTIQMIFIWLPSIGSFDLFFRKDNHILMRYPEGFYQIRQTKDHNSSLTDNNQNRDSFKLT